MDNLIAYKFVQGDVEPLENLKNLLVYKAKEKLLSGQKLTREEKDKIVSSCFCNNYGVYQIRGWAFHFHGFMKTYLVKQYGRWSEYKAFDKTSLRKRLYGTIQCIASFDEKSSKLFV